MDRNKPQPPAPAARGVALRKESVDRNKHIPEIFGVVFGRSPQGERG